MSIKLMSAIFDAEFRDMEYTDKDGQTHKTKASTAKLVLLAIADHANDYGEGSYPGFERLTIKTALSRQGLIDTMACLEQNGLLNIDRKGSRLGTNNYTINIRSLPAIAKELPDVVKPLDYQNDGVVKPLDQEWSSHLTTVVKPLDQNHQLTTNQPSDNQKKDFIDGMLEIAQMPGAKKAIVKQYIAERIKSKLGLNPSGKDAESFIDYAANEHKKGNSFDVFLSWWIENNPKPEYWSFRRMEQMYPRAFQAITTNQPIVTGGNFYA